MYLYILKFQNFDLVKIGVTRGLNSRITTLEKELGVEFDLNESYLFYASNSRLIRALEMQFLHDLYNDFVPDTHPYCLPRHSKMTYKEIRLDRNIENLLNLFLTKVNELDLPFDFYVGIDLSSIFSDIIPPEVISPRNLGPQPIMKKFQQICDENEICSYSKQYELIYEYIIANGGTVEPVNPNFSNGRYIVLEGS